jgi:hypothetical protein
VYTFALWLQSDDGANCGCGVGGIFVIRVSLDMIWKYIDDLWTIIYSVCDALFYLADFCFLWLK